MVRLSLDGEVLWINASGLRTFGAESQAEVLGRRLDDLALASERARVAERVEAAATQTVHFIFRSEVGHPCHCTLNPVRDSAGRPAWIMGIAHDVSERREIEARLEHSEAKLQLALSASAMGVWEYSTLTGELTWSDASYEVYGVSRDTFSPSGETYLELVHPDDVPLLAGHVAEALESPQRFRTEHRIVPPDGQVRWVESHGRSFANAEGTIDRTVGTVRDVTERVQLREQIRQSQQLESLGVLAGGIAHDFNNLLVGILGQADCALDELEDEPSPVATSLAEIIRSGERAAELCQQMLAYSGRGQFVVSVQELRDVVQEMARLVESAVPKGATLFCDFPASTPRIKADVTQIRQVVMNLITNAAEAVDPHGGNVTVRTGRTLVDEATMRVARPPGSLKPGSYAFVEVVDDGVGMHAKTLSTIFDPFFTTKMQGRGLGLAAVLGIVHAHGGAITVESTYGKGTRFCVLLPPTDEAVKVRASPIGQRVPRSATILVVDDEDTVRRVAARCLRRAGYKVAVQGRGEDALRHLEAHADRIDAVLLDVTMPGMGGGATYAAIRKQHPDLPILLMSGYSESDVLDAIGESAEFMQKPFRSRTLISLVRGMLG